MARGGYQQPSNPAPVSGPGALSKRTDGQAMQRLGDASYGEQTNFEQIQRGAPMSDSGQGPSMPGMESMMPSVMGLAEETTRPDEPVTAGSPSGPGGGPEMFGIKSPPKQSADEALSIAQTYLPSLERTARQPGTPESFIRFVRYLRAQSNAQA